MAEIGEMPTQADMTRLERRRQFRWFHRLAPVMVMQAYAAIYVIKIWDEYFDVTGMVRFGVGLLMIVLCMHLLILEGLLYVKTCTTDCMQMYKGALAQYALDLDPESQHRAHLDAECVNGTQMAHRKTGGKSTAGNTPVDAIIDQTDYSCRVKDIGYSNYQNIESSDIGSYSLVDTENKWYSPGVMTSSSESGTEDSDLSSSSEYSTSITSSSSSSYLNISASSSSFPRPTSSSPSSHSPSSSYCEIEVVPVAESSATEYRISSTTPKSLTTEYALAEDCINPHDDITGRMDEQINMGVPYINDTTNGVAYNNKMEDTTNGDIDNNVSPLQEAPTIHTKDIVSESTISPKSKMAAIADVGKVIARLRSLQDIYVAVDVFKALLCLDVLRQLLVYYSIFYWRLSIIQTLPVFVLPSAAIVGEVSLTVVCFIS